MAESLSAVTMHAKLTVRGCVISFVNCRASGAVKALSLLLG
jgi:hypothetical protein